MINKLVHGITGLLLPIGLYGANSLNSPQQTYGAYNRSSVRSTAVSVNSPAFGGASPNIKSVENLFLTSGTIAEEVQLTRGKRELVIIDEAVPDKHLLSSYLRPGVDIVQINSGEDGLNQLEKILADYQDLDALHIVSHGRAGELYLGDTLVDEQQLQQRPHVLAALDKALNDDADLLLFGCDIASTDEGNQLLQIIANEAHVDVAASNDLTGNAALGGDWDLEVMIGQIDTEQPFSEIALKDFSAVLQTAYDFQGLGFDDSAGVGYKTVGAYAATYHVVSNTFENSGSNMYWNEALKTPSAAMKIQADEADAAYFDVTALNIIAYTGRTVAIDSTSTVVFFDDGGGVLQTMTLNADKDLTDTSTDIFAFFDNNTTSPVTGVFLVELNLVVDAGSGEDLTSIEFETITLNNITAPGGGGDSTPPTISAVSIPNSSHKVGDEVTATITVTSDTDDYTTATTPVTGTIAGYALGSLSKTNDTTYTATFTITDGGTDVLAGSTVPVNFTLDDSSDNTSSAFTTAISQASDAIYANVPDVTLTADTNTIAEDGGVSTLTASLTNSLNNQWPAAVTVNLAYTGTGTAATDYSKSDSIVISAGSSSGTATVTGTADTLFDAAVAETAIVDIDNLSVGNEGAPNQQTISITDAESAPSVTLSVGNSSIDEDGGTSTITAALSHPTFADVTVNLAYSGTATGGGTDYATPSSSIIISALSTSADASTGITAVDDGDILADVNVIIDITSVTGGGGAAENGTQQKTITIPDDDGDSIPPSITAVSIVKKEYYLNEFVGVNITVAPDADDYTTGSGGISGRINGVRLHTLNRVNDTTYVSVFRVTEDVTERAQGEPIPVSITLTDSNGNTSATFTTSITQANTSITPTPQEVSIRGNITDSGNAAEGILLYVYDSDGEFIAAAASGSSGNYNIDGLAAGNYRVDVYDSDALDAQTPARSSTVTITDEDVVLNITLGDASEPIECSTGYVSTDTSCVVDPEDTTEQQQSTIDNSITELSGTDLTGSTSLSDEFVSQVNTLVSATKDLSANTATDLDSGTATTNTALDVVNTVTQALDLAGGTSQAGGNVDTAAVNNSLSGITDIFTALSNSNDSLTSSQVSQVQGQTESTVQTVTSLIDSTTTVSSAESLIDSVSDVVNSAVSAGASLTSDLVSSAQSLTQTALQNTLSDIASALDSSLNVTFTDVASTQTLLSNNTQLLSAVLDTVSIELTSTVSLDQTSTSSALESAGLSSASASSLATDLAQFTNPSGISVTTSRGTVTAADTIANSFGSVTDEKVTVSVDDNSSKVDLVLGDATIPVQVSKVSLVPKSIPEGITNLPNGSVLSVSDGIASKLVPAPKDPVGFASALSGISNDVSFKSNGSVAITNSSGLNFSGTFSFEGLSTSSSSTSDDVTFTAPKGSPADPSYSYKVNYPDGTSQNLLPIVKDDDFFDSLKSRNLNLSTNRSTGVVNVSGTNFKPDYFVQPLSSADSTFLNNNQDSTGTAYRATDANGDGVTDYEVISSTGVQVVYGVP